MSVIKPTSVPSKRLAQSINASSTTIQLNNILGWDGAALTSAYFGDHLYCVLRNDPNTIMEIMELDPTTIASTNITISKRGLKFTGDLSTEVSGNKLTWIKNETIVELGTDVPQLFGYDVHTEDAQTINGVKTFTSFPVKSGSTTPTSSDHLATKAYVDSVVAGTVVYDQQTMTGTAGETLAAGNLVYFKESDQRWWKTDADASTTAIQVKLGVAQGSASAAGSVNILIGGLEKNQSGLTAGSKYYLSGTAGAITTTPGTFRRFVGTALTTTYLLVDFVNDVTLVHQDGRENYAADAGANDTYAITLDPAPVAYVTGMRIWFKANTVNTGAATLNVNSIGAVTIKRNSGLDLDDGDIKAGQIVEVVYDGTNFQMESQTGNKPAVIKFGGGGADGALTISSGTTTIDIANAEILVKEYSSISITGTGALAFSNPNSNGSAIFLRCSGDVTITTSATRAIDIRALGSPGGAGGVGAGGNGSAGGDSPMIIDADAHGGGGAGGSGQGGGGAGGIAVSQAVRFYSSAYDHIRSSHQVLIIPATGGGGGENSNLGTAGGAGGQGAGSIYIECAGSLTISGTIDGSGTVGTAGTNGGASGGGGGGGGGAGGMVIILYNTLVSNTGTYTVTGGAGGAGGTGSAGSGGGGGGGGAIVSTAGTVGTTVGGNAGGAGGAGATGFSVVAKNTVFA